MTDKLKKVSFTKKRKIKNIDVTSSPIQWRNPALSRFIEICVKLEIRFLNAEDQYDFRNECLISVIISNAMGQPAAENVILFIINKCRHIKNALK